MKPKIVYLALGVAGEVFPFTQLVPWVFEHGLDARLLVQQLFANRVSAFFGLDVVVSAIIVVVFAILERQRLRTRLCWLPIAATLCVGVSFGLPLLLYLRELEIEMTGTLVKAQ